MEKESALSRIIDSVESYLNSHKVKCFYIGKTDNFEERAESHRQEGYNQIFELAIASSDAIAYLEDAVISYLSQDHTYVLLHVSGDNEPAISLYKKLGFVVVDSAEIYEM